MIITLVSASGAPGVTTTAVALAVRWPVPYLDAVAGEGVDGPAVAVLHPVGGADPEPAVVAAGDDHVPDARLVAIGQPDLAIGLGAGEAVEAGALVELCNEVASGCKHHRVAAVLAVVGPGGEQLLGHRVGVADVDPVAVEVEAERIRCSVAQREGGGALGGVSEADEFGEVERAVGGVDVA